VLAVDGVNNEDSPEAQLMRTLIDAFAQYERALIHSRIVQALGHKKAKGERVGGVPYEKQVADDGKTLVPSERDKKLVARIRLLHRGGMSVRQIAEKVTAEGYRSQLGSGELLLPTEARPRPIECCSRWSPATTHRSTSPATSHLWLREPERGPSRDPSTQNPALDGGRGPLSQGA
jgi:hypothetical protein